MLLKIQAVKWSPATCSETSIHPSVPVFSLQLTDIQNSLYLEKFFSSPAIRYAGKQQLMSWIYCSINVVPLHMVSFSLLEESMLKIEQRWLKTSDWNRQELNTQQRRWELKVRGSSIDPLLTEHGCIDERRGERIENYWEKFWIYYCTSVNEIWGKRPYSFPSHSNCHAANSNVSLTSSSSQLTSWDF